MDLQSAAEKLLTPHTGPCAAEQGRFSPDGRTIYLSTNQDRELIAFTSPDGLKLTGWLYRPRAAARPGPLVLSFHGGPEAQERPRFDYIYQALLAQGIAIFAPNVRGSAGFGKTFVSLDNGALRTNAVKDIAACAQYVVKAGLAAPGRIGIMGGSYGGYMTMAGLTEYPELFAAGVNAFGIVNFETFFAHTEPWMAAISTVEYGAPRHRLIGCAPYLLSTGSITLSRRPSCSTAPMIPTCRW